MEDRKIWILGCIDYFFGSNAALGFLVLFIGTISFSFVNQPIFWLVEFWHGGKDIAMQSFGITTSPTISCIIEDKSVSCDVIVVVFLKSKEINFIRYFFVLIRIMCLLSDRVGRNFMNLVGLTWGLVQKLLTVYMPEQV